MSSRSIIRVFGVPLAAVLLAVVAACSSLPGVTVSRTEGQNAPVVASDDPEEDAIGAREHPRIVASYGGIYSDRQP